MESELWDYTCGCCCFLNQQPVTASPSSVSSKPRVSLLPACSYPYPYVAIPVFSLNFSVNPEITSSKEPLRELADEVPYPLSITFEKLWQPGEVPDDWEKKKENITSILKNGKMEDLESCKQARIPRYQ